MKRGDIMKIERINDTQIRCTLSGFDLSVRNLSLGELAYGSDKARRLFNEMIQKASNEVGFDIGDTPVMIEAIPLSSESVVLIITKVDDPEELDTRFARFSSPYSDDMPSYSDEVQSLDGIFPTSIRTSSSDGNDDSIRVFIFNSLDSVIDASSSVYTMVDNIFSSLYKDAVEHRYILVLKKGNADNKLFANICNLLSEFGIKQNKANYAAAYIEEHCELLIPIDAIESLSKAR